MRVRTRAIVYPDVVGEQDGAVVRIGRKAAGAEVAYEGDIADMDQSPRASWAATIWSALKREKVASFSLPVPVALKAKVMRDAGSPSSLLHERSSRVMWVAA